MKVRAGKAATGRVCLEARAKLLEDMLLSFYFLGSFMMLLKKEDACFLHAEPPSDPGFSHTTARSQGRGHSEERKLIP